MNDADVPLHHKPTLLKWKRHKGRALTCYRRLVAWAWGFWNTSSAVLCKQRGTELLTYIINSAGPAMRACNAMRWVGQSHADANVVYPSLDSPISVSTCLAGRLLIGGTCVGVPTLAHIRGSFSAKLSGRWRRATGHWWECRGTSAGTLLNVEGYHIPVHVAP